MMHPMETMIGQVAEFEFRWADQYAAASMEIPSDAAPSAAPGTLVRGTGINLLFRPDQGAAESQRGLWVSGAPLGTMRLADAPAEIIIRAFVLLDRLEELLETRSDEIKSRAAFLVGS